MKNMREPSKLSAVILLGVCLLCGLSVFAYTDLPWKFEGNTDRVAKAQNSGTLAGALDTFVSSIKASAPLDWFSSFPPGLMLIFR